MPAVAKLSYHRATFELLEREPLLSDGDQQILAEWERTHPYRLPLAVREWFTLQDAVALLGGAPTGSEWAAGLGDVLRGFEALRSSPPTERKLLCFVVICQGVTLYDLELDGSEDPYVVVVDCGQELTEPPRERFSTFLFSQFWPGLPGFRYTLRANDRAFGPMELDYLIENFTEGPRSSCREGETWYRFFNAVGRISVTKPGEATSEGRARWDIMANSEESLYAVAKQVWGCGTVSRSLRGTTKVEKAVLQRLRAEFQPS
jgi:hypothetical protein